MEPIPEEIVERYIGGARQYCVNTSCKSHITVDRYGCGKWGLAGKDHPCPDFIQYQGAFKENKDLPLVGSIGYIPDAIERRVLRVEVLSRQAKASSWIDTGIERIPRYDVSLKVKTEDGSVHVTNEKNVLYDIGMAKAKLLKDLIASLEFAKKEDKMKIVEMMFPDAIKELE